MNERAPLVSDDPEGDRITVVAIDDHPTYVHGLATLLEDAAPDIEVVAVASVAPVGIDLVVERRPHVVLVDLHMPLLDGVEVTRRVVSLAPESKVLILTVSDDPSDVAEALRAGARGYLSKQVEPGELISAVRAVAAGEVVLASFAADALFTSPRQTARLTDEEICLLRAISNGTSYSEVAAELAISESTLKRQLAEIQRKLNVQNKLQAVAYVARRGLL